MRLVFMQDLLIDEARSFVPCRLVSQEEVRGTAFTHRAVSVR